MRNPSVLKQRPDLLCLRQITCYLGWLITVVLYRWLAGWICFLLSGWLSTDYHLCCTEVIIFTCTVRLDVYVCKLTISLICHVCCWFFSFSFFVSSFIEQLPLYTCSWNTLTVRILLICHVWYILSFSFFVSPFI